MTRNLSRRVEAVTPIIAPEIFADLQEILGVMLADNRKAWELQSEGTFIQRKPKQDEEVRSSHDTFMDMALQSARLLSD